MENPSPKFKCVTPEISRKLFIMWNLPIQIFQLTGHPWDWISTPGDASIFIYSGSRWGGLVRASGSRQNKRD
jgi:hypothetical protein